MKITTINGALKRIKDMWSELPHETREGHEAVWIATSDKADSYEVDEEWIGMKGDGSLVWAYASGCSCWDGDYDTDIIKDIKVFEFTHKEMAEGWKDAIIAFANGTMGEAHDIPRKYSRW